jgi:hypothetical protein
MKLRPETIAAHRSRHARQPHYPTSTLAPDPHQPQLDLRPSIGHNSRRFADCCPRCKCVHSGPTDAEHCRQANAQREQE